MCTNQLICFVLGALLIIFGAIVFWKKNLTDPQTQVDRTSLKVPASILLIIIGLGCFYWGFTQINCPTKNQKSAIISTDAVIAKTPLIKSFTVFPKSIQKNGVATLTRSVENADSVTISSIGKVEMISSKSVTPSLNQTYTLHAYVSGVPYDTALLLLVQPAPDILVPEKFKGLIGSFWKGSLTYSNGAVGRPQTIHFIKFIKNNQLEVSIADVNNSHIDTMFFHLQEDGYINTKTINGTYAGLNSPLCLNILNNTGIFAQICAEREK